MAKKVKEEMLDKKEYSVEELKAVRASLRMDRTSLAVQGGLVPSVYNERLQSVSLRIDAIDKAIWHLENPEVERIAHFPA